MSTLAAGANTNFPILTAAQANEFVQPVVVRIVGNAYVGMRGVAAADDAVIVIGIRVESEAGQLNPLTNIDANWMWYWTVNFFMSQTISGQLGPERLVPFDIRVMRKVPVDGLLKIIAESAAGSASVELGFAARVLVREAAG